MRTRVAFDDSDEQRRRLEVIATDGKSRMKHVHRGHRPAAVVDTKDKMNKFRIDQP